MPNRLLLETGMFLVSDGAIKEIYIMLIHSTGRPEPAPRDDHGRYKEGKGRSRVICTHFLATGQMERRLWALDMRFTASHLSPTVERGYHFWAIPYVRLMRKHHWAEAIMLPLAIWRAKEIAYQMGEAQTPNYPGKLIRVVGESACWLLGCLVPRQDWRSLYKPSKKSA